MLDLLAKVLACIFVRSPIGSWGTRRDMVEVVWYLVDTSGFLVAGKNEIVVVLADKQLEMKTRGSEIGGAGSVRFSDGTNFV